MGIFSKKKPGQEAKNTAPAVSALSAFSGRPVQVFTQDGEFLFTAAVQPVAHDAAYLHWQSGTDPGALRSRNPDTFPVALRGYNEKTGRTLRATGLARQVNERTWAMARMTLLDGTSERSAYRQPVVFEGTAVLMTGNLVPFRSVDLSIRGAGLLLIRPPYPPHWGERLRMESPFLARLGIPPLPCQICHTAWTGTGSYQCGCVFEAMSVETERALSVLILRLQTHGDTFIL